MYLVLFLSVDITQHKNYAPQNIILIITNLMDVYTVTSHTIIKLYAENPLHVIYSIYLFIRPPLSIMHDLIFVKYCFYGIRYKILRMRTTKG